MTLGARVSPIEAEPISFLEFGRWLDAASESVARGKDFERLLWDLDALRSRTSIDRWRGELLPALLDHALYGLALQCPFSQRAIERPRGYVADPLFVDFFHREPTVAALWERATPLGRALCEFWMGSPAAVAVRAWRDLVSARLEHFALRRPWANVLSTSCGHLREVTPGGAASRGAFRRFLALDHDEEALDHVARHRRFSGLELRHVTSTDLSECIGIEERFDLIQALGPFEPLHGRLAREHVTRLFDALAPRGSLLIASFLPTTPNLAAFEAFQDWLPITRSRAEIEALASDVDAHRISRRSYVELGCIGVATLERS